MVIAVIAAVLWATTFSAWADESCLLQAMPASQELQVEVKSREAQAAQCPDGTTDFSYDWTGLDGQFPSGGPLTLMAGIAPNLDLVGFNSNTNRCIGAAIWNFEINDFASEPNGKGDEDLQKCPNGQVGLPDCHMLVVQENGPTPGKVNDCAPPANSRARIELQFTQPILLISLNFWDIENSNDLTIRFVPGDTTTANAGGNGEASPEQFFNKLVTDWSLIFRGSGGVNGIRYCRPNPPGNPPGGVIGDPHISTLEPRVSSQHIDTFAAWKDAPDWPGTRDGKHYLLLNQGSFSLWRFSGPQAEFHSEGRVEKSDVDWQIYTHYSGHQSFTKGLLLVDQSAGHFRRALEMTSQDCVWRTRTEGNDWEPQLLSAAVGTGFNITSHNHVRLYMNTKDGHREVAVLSLSCRPSHNLDLAIQMRRPEDVKFVQGELRAARKARKTSMLQMTDDEFEQRKSWKALGGSEAASLYLEATDEPTGSNFVSTCGEAQKADAAKICAKHLGENMQNQTGNAHSMIFLDDCVFDVCMGAGEVAAELAAELLASTKELM